MKGALVVFLGPSLPLAQARKLAPGARFLPPARQGDVWRALSTQPRALALIDGVFEAAPSVWHHELLAALDAGVAVFGASSMGALRAAELWTHGMIGVGQVYQWLRAGVVKDDSEVALLHADAEHGYRALTVPLVNVRAAAARLPRAQGVKLLRLAEGLFYQERTWPRLLQAAPAALRERLEPLLRAGAPDVKAQDARECLSAAHAFARSGAAAPEPRAGSAPSSRVRHRRLAEGQPPAKGPAPLDLLRARPDAEALAEQGVLRLALAAWARGLGLRAPAEEVKRLRAVHARSLRGLDAGEQLRFCEELALARLVVEEAPRLLPDGPGYDEGLAFEARRRGLWPR